MSLFAAFVALGFAVRSVAPNKVRLRPKVRWIALPFVALFMQAMLGIPSIRHGVGSDRFGVVIASYVVVGVWLTANAVYQMRPLRLPAAFITFGWLANGLALSLNHGMPVSRAALSEIGAHQANMQSGNLYKHIIAGPHVVLGWLGDVIPVNLPVLRNVISIGDVAMFIGVLLAVRCIDFGFIWKVKKPAEISSTDIAIQAPQST